jgi:L-histidine N-alpha-methyltransferase
VSCPEANLSRSSAILATADDLARVLATHLVTRKVRHRLVTFFGMIPNFEPQDILPKLAKLIRRPGYAPVQRESCAGRGLRRGQLADLPQYDNDLTREWLLTFLLGSRRGAQRWRVAVWRGAGNKGAATGAGAVSLQARLRFTVEGETFSFRRGESIRLFFSYRYTPELVRTELAKHGLRVCDQWLTQSGEEGVFLCRRK